MNLHKSKQEHWFRSKFRKEQSVENQIIIIENLSVENVEKSKYLEIKVTHTNICEEIKRRINLGNACY